MRNGSSSELVSTRVALAFLLGLVGWSLFVAPDYRSSTRLPSRESNESAPAHGASLVRYRFDAARDQGWVLTSDGVFLYGATNPERVLVTLPTWQWLGPPQGCLPDLTIGPRGEAVISSDVLPTLWRVDADTLAVSVHPLELEGQGARYGDKDAGFSGLVYRPDRQAYFAASALDGALWKIDPTLTRAVLALPARPETPRGRRGFRCSSKRSTSDRVPR